MELNCRTSEHYKCKKLALLEIQLDLFEVLDVIVVKFSGTIPFIALSLANKSNMFCNDQNSSALISAL
jgi:hypothetical protein